MSDCYSLKLTFLHVAFLSGLPMGGSASHLIVGILLASL